MASFHQQVLFTLLISIAVAYSIECYSCSTSCTKLEKAVTKKDCKVCSIAGVSIKGVTKIKRTCHNKVSWKSGCHSVLGAVAKFCDTDLCNNSTDISDLCSGESRLFGHLLLAMLPVALMSMFVI